MTFREKLQIDHPDAISELYMGGCRSCPYDYNYCAANCPAIGSGGASETTCSACWDREIPEKEPETFRELLQKEHPERVSPEFNGGCFACPTTYGYESDEDNEKACAHMNCTECWDRKLPKKAEEPVEIKIEEEKKMRNLGDVIRDAVLNSISDSDIEYAVKECFESHDYSDMIERAVENYLYENIEDIADDIVTEAVRDYMRENL